MSLFRYKVLLLILIFLKSIPSIALVKAPEFDDSRSYISAHAGGVLKFRGNYFLYGENRSDHEQGVSIYQSSNMLNWRYKGLALDINDVNKFGKNDYFIERPKIIYNKKNNYFVMWFHVEEKKQGYKAALVGVASSKNILGPYSLVSISRINKFSRPINGNLVGERKANLINKRDFASGQMSRDIGVFIDDDDEGYLISTTEDNATIAISQMGDDYTSLTGKYIRVQPGRYEEAPVMFKIQGKYYLITSGTTGWKPNGATLYESNKVFGAWKRLGSPIISKDPNDIKTTFHSQGSNVFKYNGILIFMADSWNTNNLAKSRYIWKLVQLDSSGKPRIYE